MPLFADDGVYKLWIRWRKEFEQYKWPELLTGRATSTISCDRSCGTCTYLYWVWLVMIDLVVFDQWKQRSMANMQLVIMSRWECGLGTKTCFFHKPIILAPSVQAAHNILGLFCKGHITPACITVLVHKLPFVTILLFLLAQTICGVLVC